MKKLIYCLLVFTICNSACSDDDDKDKIIGSNKIISEERDLSDFENIDISSIINVNVSYDEAQSVVVKANDNIINRVRTIVSGNTLLIDLKDGSYDNISVEIDIKIPDVESIDNEGTGNVDLSGFENLDKIDFNSVGTGNITAQGSADDLSIELTGTGSFRGFEFLAKNVNAKLTGTGNIEVFCTEELDGSITGTGNIYYKGNPDIDVTITGIGKVIDAN